MEDLTRLSSRNNSLNVTVISEFKDMGAKTIRAMMEYTKLHMRGPLGTQHMTKTFVQMLVQIYPHLDPTKSGNVQNKTIDQGHNFPQYFWLNVGSPISPAVRPRRRRRAKILNQF